MESDLELKHLQVDGREVRDSQLADRLVKAFDDKPIRVVGHETGYHPETVRRYLQDVSKVPADFVGQAVQIFELNAHYLLTGDDHAPGETELRQVTTDRLINELSRRIQMIENNAVGSVLVHKVNYDGLPS